MAIQVLVDHGINLKDVTLITYLLTEIGVRRIFHVFPEVKIIVGKLSNVEESESKYNSEKFHDTDWLFRTRFIDSLYFGTD